METLLTDIVANIFSRLPFDTVMQQCRCVSKSWYNLIQLLIHTRSDLYLAKTHLNRLLENNHHSSTSESVILLLDQSENHQGLHFVEYDEEKGFNGNIIKKFNSPLTMDSKFWTMACSSNGLICSSVRVYDQYDDIDDNDDSSYLFYIYNPFLREYVTLPNLKSTESNSMAFGFGYVPSTGEYKVVRIFYSVGRDGDSTVGNVEVYTLGKMSKSSSSTHPRIWRSKGNIEHRLHVSSPGVLVNGSLHWLTEKVLADDDDQKVKQHDILAFDLLEEEFYSVPLPPSEWLINFQIKELGGCLCAINRGGGKRVMGMWIMENYHMQKKAKEYSSWNWKRLFCIQWRGWKGFEECFYWIKADQALLWCNSSPSLLRLDFIESIGPNLAGKKVLWPARLFHGIPHIKSFISLKALGEDDVLTIKAENKRKRRCYITSATKTKRSPRTLGEDDVITIRTENQRRKIRRYIT